VVISEKRLDQMIVAASALGWSPPVPEALWPETFERDGRTWTKESLTVAERINEVQCGEYCSGDDWLIVYNE